MSAESPNDQSFECNEDCSKVFERLPHKNNIISGQKNSYAVGRKIAPGKYGAVYEVLRRKDGKRFAAKLEICSINTNALNMDYIVLKAAAKANLDYIPELIDRGKIENHFKFLVIKLLGKSLCQLRLLFENCRFSAPTSLRLALEMLNALKQLHSLGYIHRDVKPSNFVTFSSTEGTKLYLIDFGLCRQYRSSTTNELKKPREQTQFRGTTKYASLAAHRKEELSRKDDLESWFYVIIEFMSGELPWHSYQQDEKDAVEKLKYHARTVDGIIELLKYSPIVEFQSILKYLDNLTFFCEPDYDHISNLIQLSIKNNDINPNQPYDWELPDDVVVENIK